MQQHSVVSTIGVLVVVLGLAACASKPPEPAAAPKMTNEELDSNGHGEDQQ